MGGLKSVFYGDAFIPVVSPQREVGHGPFIPVAWGSF